MRASRGQSHLHPDFPSHLRPVTGAPSPPSRRGSPSSRRRVQPFPLTLCKAHRQVDLMYSGRTVASRVSCSSGNNGTFPPCLCPGFLGFPVVSVNFHLFKAIVRSPASSVVLGICGRSLP
uniref:Uncharacterized protein n=1 Tax=Avena sativa TaxID=4498 RepID=A0ACD5YP73_AVESA